MHRNNKPVYILFSIILLLASCHSAVVTPQDARILIISPSAESTSNTDNVTIKTYVERFNLVEKIGQQNSPGEGHIVYYMDATPPIEQGVSALTTEGTYTISTEKTLTWNDVEQGKHTFWVQLVNNDNTPLEPAAAVRVYVTIK